MKALVSHFQRMAAYNTGANRILYEACAELSDSERKQPRPAFFGSIHGTLNHILLGDRIWMTRFRRREAPSTGLDEILYEDFAELREARRAEDAGIEAFMDGLDERGLAGAISYINNEGRPMEESLPVLLAHFFNHQTHHRGQVHGLLSQTDLAPPVLDLHRVLNP
ncbi:MAG: DinB family protein [bacterium]